MSDARVDRELRALRRQRRDGRDRQSVRVSGVGALYGDEWGVEEEERRETPWDGGAAVVSVRRSKVKELSASTVLRRMRQAAKRREEKERQVVSQQHVAVDDFEFSSDSSDWYDDHAHPQPAQPAHSAHPAQRARGGSNGTPSPSHAERREALSRLSRSPSLSWGSARKSFFGGDERPSTAGSGGRVQRRREEAVAQSLAVRGEYDGDPLEVDGEYAWQRDSGRVRVDEAGGSETESGPEEEEEEEEEEREAAVSSPVRPLFDDDAVLRVVREKSTRGEPARKQHLRSFHKHRGSPVRASMAAFPFPSHPADDPRLLSKSVAAWDPERISRRPVHVPDSPQQRLHQQMHQMQNRQEQHMRRKEEERKRIGFEVMRRLFGDAKAEEMQMKQEMEQERREEEQQQQQQPPPQAPAPTRQRWQQPPRRDTSSLSLLERAQKKVDRQQQQQALEREQAAVEQDQVQPRRRWQRPPDPSAVRARRQERKLPVAIEVDAPEIENREQKRAAFEAMRRRKLREQEARRKGELERRARHREKKAAEHQRMMQAAEERRARARQTSKQSLVETAGAKQNKHARSNRKLIHNALSFVCLAGGAMAEQRLAALEELKLCPGANFVILLKPRNLKFRGLYCLNLDAFQAFRIYGEGPPRIEEGMVSDFMKYDSAGKQFQVLPLKSFSATTDAVCLKTRTRSRRRRRRPTRDT